MVCEVLRQIKASAWDKVLAVAALRVLRVRPSVRLSVCLSRTGS